MTDEGQSGYYQAVAREFLRHRGGPFFLSPRDVAVIAGWERDRIPLRVVLEGVGRAFDSRRDRARGTKGLPLAFCDPQVRKAMAQHADRGAGRRRSAAAPRSEKAGRARREVERCLLRGLAADESELRALLEKAAGLLSAEPADEGALETIDEAVDEFLWRRAGAPTAAGPAGRSAAPPPAAARTRSVKEERRKRRVPYVSLFYY